MHPAALHVAKLAWTFQIAMPDLACGHECFAAMGQPHESGYLQGHMGSKTGFKASLLWMTWIL